MGPTDNNSALFQVMAWQWIGDKSLPEPMVTQLTDAYMRHQASLSYVYYGYVKMIVWRMSGVTACVVEVLC